MRMIQPEPSWCSTDKASSIELDWHRPGIVSIRWTGHISLEAMRYFDVLQPMLDGYDGRVHLLYDMLGMTSYDRAIVPRHGQFALANPDKLGRIAVATSLARVRFAIATVLLLQPRPVRGFSTIPDAEAWLVEPEAQAG